MRASSAMYERRHFLPVNRRDMEERGWDSLDFLMISGDAYVDHPSFGHAAIGRLLESEGYRVGIVAQPDWRGTAGFKIMGRPRYGVLITGGVVDSMVNIYSPSGKRRHGDSYAPGGESGQRPDRAVIVYANRVREAFGPGMAIILGGIEASLRRFSHYDFISDRLRRSIILDARADLLVYGMGERPIVEIADRLRKGIPVDQIRDVRGTVSYGRLQELPADVQQFIEECSAGRWPRFRNTQSVLLPNHETMLEDRESFARGYKSQYDEQDPVHGRTLIQQEGGHYVVQCPPSPSLTMQDLDRFAGFLYTRRSHPDYAEAGGIPALTEVQFSVTGHRGCYGSCAFCALAFHQGRHIQTRSEESILAEVRDMVQHPDFRGTITDIGGPTANFRKQPCSRIEKRGACRGRECLHSNPCPALKVDHTSLVNILDKVRELPGVKNVFIRSGIRHDYLLLDPQDRFLTLLCRHHVSGQLRVAPEHSEDSVLEVMGKPSISSYRRFVQQFQTLSRRLGKEQYVVPYLMSGHPGCTLEDAIKLAEFIRDLDHAPLQVQEFSPTPGTMATAMYYSGIDPRTMEPIHVPRGRERTLQRALLQYWKPENVPLVHEALRLAHRSDLIGRDRLCLISQGRQANQPGRMKQQLRRKKDPGGQKASPGSKRPAVKQQRGRRQKSTNAT